MNNLNKTSITNNKVMNNDVPFSVNMHTNYSIYLSSDQEQNNDNITFITSIIGDNHRDMNSVLDILAVTDFFSMHADMNMNFLDVNIDNIMQQSLYDQELRKDNSRNLKLKTSAFSDTSKAYTTCAICSDEFENTDIVSTLDCKHIFHEKCIREWGCYKPECPVCKKVIENNNSEAESAPMSQSGASAEES
jgi:hypothetical protein